MKKMGDFPLTKDQEVLVERFFNECNENLKKYLLRLTKWDEELSDDLLQETFMKIIKAIGNGQYIEDGHPYAWIKKIAHNVFIDYTRKKGKIFKAYPSIAEKDLPENLGSTSLNCEEVQVNKEMEDEIRALIELLPEDQRFVVIERIYHNTKFRNLASQKGESINTLIGRMRNALMNLRKIIKKRGLDLEGYTQR